MVSSGTVCDMNYNIFASSLYFWDFSTCHILFHIRRAKSTRIL